MKKSILFIFIGIFLITLITGCRRKRVDDFNVSEKIDIIVNNGPQTSSNPFDYVKANKEIYDELLSHKKESFEYSINDLNVIIKDATNGAWYGKCCEKCNMYPCHDALMVLRVLPSDNFQICLMNEENIHKFKKDNKEKVLLKCLDIYKNAQFRGE